ncbi:MAG: HupE/UreJ family protein [Pseudomonadota bacterium]
MHTLFPNLFQRIKVAAEPVTIATRFAFLTFLLFGPLAQAHEVRPAIADITVSQDSVDLRISLNAEALLAGIDLDGLVNTDEAENNAAYDMLRALSAEELAMRVNEGWAAIDGNIKLEIGFTSLSLDLQEVEVVAEPNQELQRETIVIATAQLPEGDAGVTLGWAREYGTLLVRQISEGADEETLYTGLLTSGSTSEIIPRGSITPTSTLSTARLALVAGFQHLILGYEHIAFALALFFFTTRVPFLFWQAVTIFLGHLAALGLGITGLVSIATSTADIIVSGAVFVLAVENIVANGKSHLRLPLVFIVAFLHGLGLVSALREAGLEHGQLALNAFAFNLGVDAGHWLVLVIAFLLIGVTVWDQPWYRKFIAVPASVAIGLAGVWFFLQSTAFA